MKDYILMAICEAAVFVLMDMLVLIFSKSFWNKGQKIILKNQVLTVLFLPILFMVFNCALKEQYNFPIVYTVTVSVGIGIVIFLKAHKGIDN